MRRPGGAEGALAEGAENVGCGQNANPTDIMLRPRGVLRILIGPGQMVARTRK